jgi:YgiT-type zinc finger domain-containing protein
MKCAVCGVEVKTTTTDLQFKVGNTTIVILKGIPVIQCASCPEYLIQDEVLRRADEILANVEDDAALETARYAA